VPVDGGARTAPTWAAHRARRRALAASAAVALVALLAVPGPAPARFPGPAAPRAGAPGPAHPDGARPPYLLAFEESGLAADTNWTVYVDGTVASGPIPTLTFSVGNGTYLYSVPAVGALRPTPSNGQVNVTGQDPPVVPITFARSVTLRYPVWFRASGLPNGTPFSVNVSGVGVESGPAVEFNLTNGTHPYAIGAPSGWNSSEPNGTVVVPGASVSVTVPFDRLASATGPALSPLAAAALIALAAGAVLVAGLAVWLARRGRRPPPVRVLQGELVRSGAPGAAPPTAGGAADRADPRVATRRERA
jgi:hypothetical protein